MSSEVLMVGVTVGEKTAERALRTPGTHWDSDDLAAGVALMVRRAMAAELGRGEDDGDINVAVTLVDGQYMDPTCDAKYEYDLDATLDADDLQAINKGFAWVYFQMKGSV